MAAATICEHVLDVRLSFHKKHLQTVLKKSKKLTCSEAQCSHGLPHLWACLGDDCTFIGCGRDQNRHLMAHYNLAKKHGLEEEHCVCINLRTKMIWCYACDEEVIDADYGKREAAYIEKLRDALTVPVTSSPMPPIRPVASLTSASHSRGACGLANLGNTCYANAAIQCLSNCPPLRFYFLHYIARQIKGKAKTSPLVLHFTDLLYDMWGGRFSSLRPIEVLREIRRFNPMFGGYAQQDSQEFMRCLLDRLHEDTKKEVPRIEAPTTSSEQNGDATKIKRRASASSESNGVTPALRPAPRTATPPPNYVSIVSRIFQGYLLSRIKCLKCGKISPTKDAFYDLSIPIPDDKMLDKVTKEMEAEGTQMATAKRSSPSMFSKLGNWLMLSNRTVTLEDCLHAFCTKEELMGADRYRCEHCKTLNDSQKFLRIAQPPELLCIHIKRFRHDAYFGGKLSDNVQFPLRDLDIRYHDFKDPNEPQVPIKYDLVSLVNHMGGISGGHYVAYALNDQEGKWYEFDDSWATAVSEETVKNKEAYVLFYLRQSPEKDHERKRLLSAIVAFHEEERKELAASCKDDRDADNGEPMENGSADSDLTKNGVVKRKKYFVCDEWLTRWKCTLSPGRIDNARFLCPHGQVLPEFGFTEAAISRTFTTVPEEVWTEFMSLYGGGPAVCESQFRACKECEELEKLLEARRKEERSLVTEVDRTYIKKGEMWYLISCSWLKSWAKFTNGHPPPGPIDNACLLQPDGRPKLKLQCPDDYRGIVKEVWDIFSSRYGGGPELVRPVIDIYAVSRSRSSSVASSSESEDTQPLSSASSPSTSPSFPSTMSPSKRAYYKNLNIQPTSGQNGTSSADHERSAVSPPVTKRRNGAVAAAKITSSSPSREISDAVEMKANEEKEVREKREHENSNHLPRKAVQHQHQRTTGRAVVGGRQRQEDDHLLDDRMTED